MFFVTFNRRQMRLFQLTWVWIFKAYSSSNSSAFAVDPPPKQPLGQPNNRKSQQGGSESIASNGMTDPKQPNNEVSSDEQSQMFKPTLIEAEVLYNFKPYSPRLKSFKVFLQSALDGWCATHEELCRKSASIVIKLKLFCLINFECHFFGYTGAEYFAFYFALSNLVPLFRLILDSIDLFSS